MIKTLLETVLALLDQLESPVIFHNSLASHPPEAVARLISEGILSETSKATEIPRPDRFGPGSDLIVRETPQGLFGVAGEGDYFAPVHLTEHDVRQYEVSLLRMVARLRGENGIEGTGFQNDDGLIPLGLKRVDGVGIVTPYLSLPNGHEEAILARTHRLRLGGGTGKVVLVVPRSLALSSEAQRILNESGIRILSLAESAKRGDMVLDWKSAFQLPGELAAAHPSYLFRQSGQVWTLVFEGRSTTIKDSKGLSYIAHLLQNPGQECYAADLFVAVTGGDKVLPLGSAGEVLDSKAMDEYRSHVKDLEDQLAEAARNNDWGRKPVLQQELEQLTDQLLAAKGFAGRSRTTHDDREKLRKSVSMAIDRSIKIIRKHLPALADHLHSHVDRGTFLSYRGNLPWQFS